MNVPKEINNWFNVETFTNLLIPGKLVRPSFSDGQATGVAGTSLADSQAEVASVA